MLIYFMWIKFLLYFVVDVLVVNGVILLVSGMDEEKVGKRVCNMIFIFYYCFF